VHTNAGYTHHHCKAVLTMAAAMPMVAMSMSVTKAREHICVTGGVTMAPLGVANWDGTTRDHATSRGHHNSARHHAPHRHAPNRHVANVRGVAVGGACMVAAQHLAHNHLQST
jgi:hypothetical protein